MIHYNHYLEEIGVKKEDWPFASEDQEDPRYKPDEEGFIDAEFFSLDTSLSMYIYSQLCYFRDNCLYGHPGFMTFEEWSKILDEMIEAFRLLIKNDENDSYIGNYSKRQQKKINKGLRNFIKYYNHLWY